MIVLSKFIIIEAVNFKNEKSSPIEHLYITVETPRIKYMAGVITRKAMVDLLKTKDFRVETAVFDYASRKWKKVDVSLLDDEFITTNPNEQTKDNLGELPYVNHRNNSEVGKILISDGDSILCKLDLYK